MKTLWRLRLTPNSLTAPETLYVTKGKYAQAWEAIQEAMHRGLIPSEEVTIETLRCPDPVMVR